jgi:hypothetical protein
MYWFYLASAVVTTGRQKPVPVDSHFGELFWRAYPSWQPAIIPTKNSAATNSNIFSVLMIILLNKKVDIYVMYCFLL